MKKTKLIIIAIILIIALGITIWGIYKNATETSTLEDKIEEEIAYLDERITEIINNLNNISINMYNVSENNEQGSQGNSNSKEGQSQTSQSNQGEGTSQGSSSGNSASGSNQDSSQQNGSSGSNQGSSEQSSSGGNSNQQNSSEKQGGGQSGTGEQSSNSGQGGSSEQQNSGSSQGSNSAQTEKSNNTETTLVQYQIEKNNILTSEREANWEQIKNETETLYSALTTIKLDLRESGIEEREIVKFSNLFDDAIISIKEEKKEESIQKLAEIYRYISEFYLKYDDKKYVYQTKAEIIEAYALVETGEWRQVSEKISLAQTKFLQVAEKSTKINTINKANLLLKELKEGVKLEDNDVFYIKYKNLLDEMNNLC